MPFYLLEQVLMLKHVVVENHLACLRLTTLCQAPFVWTYKKAVFECFCCGLAARTWFLLRLSQLFKPLLDRTISRDRCLAAIQLSHRLEPSGHAVYEEVDGLDIGGQHGRRFVLLRHTHRSQRRPCPICTSIGGNIRHRCGGG